MSVDSATRSRNPRHAPGTGSGIVMFGHGGNEPSSIKKDWMRAISE
jgi:hypothetical protein